MYWMMTFISVSFRHVFTYLISWILLCLISHDKAICKLCQLTEKILFVISFWYPVIILEKGLLYFLLTVWRIVFYYKATQNIVKRGFSILWKHGPKSLWGRESYCSLFWVCRSIFLWLRVRKAICVFTITSSH